MTIATAVLNLLPVSVLPMRRYFKQRTAPVHLRTEFMDVGLSQSMADLYRKYVCWRLLGNVKFTGNTYNYYSQSVKQSFGRGQGRRTRVFSLQFFPAKLWPMLMTDYALFLLSVHFISWLWRNSETNDESRVIYIQYWKKIGTLNDSWVHITITWAFRKLVLYVTDDVT